MLKAVLTKPKTFKLVECKVPKINKDEVLVKVIDAGICGSDIDIFIGENKFIEYPVSLGHEFVGEIVETGRGVRKFKVGDFITAEPIITCGKCCYCNKKDYNYCADLHILSGFFSEYIKLKEKTVYLLPKDINLKAATLIEPLAVALHAIKLSEIEKDHSILIFGAGTIGQLILQTAKHYGAGQIAIVDLVESKLKIARSNGADIAIKLIPDAKENNILKTLKYNTIDLVFDCVSNDFSLNTSIKIIKNGGKIIIIGVPKDKINLEIRKVLFKGLQIFGSFLYRDNFSESINMIKNNIINSSCLFTKTFELKNIQEAFNEICIEGRKYLKCLISF